MSFFNLRHQKRERRSDREEEEEEDEKEEEDVSPFSLGLHVIVGRSSTEAIHIGVTDRGGCFNHLSITYYVITGDTNKDTNWFIIFLAKIVYLVQSIMANCWRVVDVRIIGMLV